MKSTYKLFGTVWDGLEDSGQIIATTCNRKDMNAIISLRSLLCSDNEDDLTKLLEPFHNFGAIVINMDYHPENENPVIKTFIEKRERQINNYLLRMFDIVYCCYNTDKKVPSGATNA